MKKIFILIFLILTSHISYAYLSIVFLDVDKIYNESIAGKKSNKTIFDFKNEKNKTLNILKKEIDENTEKLKNQKNVITDEEYNNQIIELQKKIDSFNSLVNKNNIEITNLQNMIKDKYLEILYTIVEKYSKKNLIDIVLNKKDVLIGKQTLDISDEILDIMNKEFDKF